MIFSLDEDLKDTAIHTDEVHSVGSSEDDTIALDLQHLSIQDSVMQNRQRRRSSVLDKFGVLTPQHTKKFSIASNQDSINENSYNSNEFVSEETNSIPMDTFGSIHSTHTDSHVHRDLVDFTPIRVLGKGAYGKVILVKDQISQKLYAMKQLKKAEILINEKEVQTDGTNESNTGKIVKNKNIERTFAERTILSQLEHPNIVKLFYTFHDKDKLYLLLQYVPGGELFFHLKEHGTFDENTVAFYAAEISCALRFLHINGIVYRDLKPENCLLNERGHLVLTDFGLSKEGCDTQSVEKPDDIYTLHSIIGTPEYCAPEILQGLPYNKNCDWYSLGCLIFDMLVGKPPYTGNNHKVILNKIQKDKTGPKIPFYLSEGMKDMLNWLLKKDKTKRWDVDKFWSETKDDQNSLQNKTKNKRKKPSKQRELKYQSHFIFRNIDWPLMESGDLQNTKMGPVVPIITDWELAENFDEEFTSMSYDDYSIEIPSSNNLGTSFQKSNNIDIVIDKPNMGSEHCDDDIFKGFSFKASKSYLERHF